MAIKATPNGTYGTKMPGGKVLQKLFEPLMKRGIVRLTRVSG